MSADWKGFTEEDIGNYRKINEDTTEILISEKKAQPLNGTRKCLAAKRRAKTTLNSQPSKEEGKMADEGKKCKGNPEAAPLVEESECETGPIITGSSPVCLKVIEGKAYELIDRNPADASKATLEVFETRQKMLEEQNKRRKEMLAKVICDRKKQTSEEAKRLQHIQEELQKLDMLLSNDVGILRNKIEEASLNFVEAQKRYNKAEKEFLDAKQNLFIKLEQKELLTKLLCTIIEQNEMRKAQKLSELMEKLNINETTNSVIVIPESESALKDAKELSKKPEK